MCTPKNRRVENVCIEGHWCQDYRYDGIYNMKDVDITDGIALELLAQPQYRYSKRLS